MPSVAPTKLPIIDLSPFLANASENEDSTLADRRASVAASIHAACRDFGFFYVTGFNTVLSRKELDESLGIARQFFALPEEEKQRVRIDKRGDGARGWQKLGENVTQYQADHHEGYDLYRPVACPDPTKLLHGENPWPAEPPAFRPTLEAWIDKCQIIGKALMEATALGLGMQPESEEWHDLIGLVSESFWVMRCIGYPSLPGDAAGISCGAHKDYGCYTLLHADRTPGALQVFLPSDDGTDEENGARGTWIQADPVENAFVVNIGEMWEVWTNGLYRATLHRVVHRNASYRVSIPFFFEPNIDAVIKPLPSALLMQEQEDRGGSEQEIKKPVVYGQFLHGKVSGNFAP